MAEPSARKNPLGPTGVVAARRVRELREDRNWGFKELSDRLTAAGRPIPPLGLRKIEKEDRRIDADDLVALAVVLEVNPSALLLPPTVSGDVEITAAGVVPAMQAWKWADGRGPLEEPDDDDGSAAAEFQLRARPLGTRRLTANVSMRHPDDGSVVVLLAGSEVPDWAAGKIGDHVLDGGH